MDSEGGYTQTDAGITRLSDVSRTK